MIMLHCKIDQIQLQEINASINVVNQSPTVRNNWNHQLILPHQECTIL